MNSHIRFFGPHCGTIQLKQKNTPGSHFGVLFSFLLFVWFSFFAFCFCFALLCFLFWCFSFFLPTSVGRRFPLYENYFFLRDSSLKNVNSVKQF